MLAIDFDERTVISITGESANGARPSRIVNDGGITSHKTSLGQVGAISSVCYWIVFHRRDANSDRCDRSTSGASGDNCGGSASRSRGARRASIERMADIDSSDSIDKSNSINRWASASAIIDDSVCKVGRAEKSAEAHAKHNKIHG